MQLPSRNGISCDQCGAQYRQEFEYFSIDIYNARSQQGHTVPIEIVRRSRIVFSFDICSSCYDKLSKVVIEHYKAVPIGTVCDLTGLLLNGDFEYRYINITRVEVKIPSTGKANIITFPRDLELTISTQACTDLVDKVLKCREAATTWQTSSV